MILMWVVVILLLLTQWALWAKLFALSERFDKLQMQVNAIRDSRRSE
jgi:hypothetical protein